ncbi:hypothetical protein [Azospirillum sp. TSO35-2]|uniref:hypothetical protein n=1 Tax=Azospirillum sp. TSO35-2 TaxID=716796 RepID=UPI000D6126A9|nr:hypothetical protein [Azospirillum sp. TSO35-2]PWC34225.1 hypothetical protein TSO352_28435 [Azospirillum sp. TSO35-2]
MTPVVLLALFCITATPLFLAVRRGLIHRTEREIRRAGAALIAERDALEAQANELEAMQADIGRLKARLVELSTEKLILDRRSGKRAATSRRFIHEIGRFEPGRSQFTFRLAMAPGFLDRPDAKAVVHPAIWRFENEAQVWATDFGAAQMLSRSIFHDGVGVTITGGEDPDDVAGASAGGGADAGREAAAR